MTCLLLICSIATGCATGVGADPMPTIDVCVSSVSEASAFVADSTMLVGDSTQRPAPFEKQRRSGVVRTYRRSETEVATVSGSGGVKAWMARVTTSWGSSAASALSYVLAVRAPFVKGDSTWIKRPPELLDRPPAPPGPPSDRSLPLFNMPVLPAASVDVGVPPVTGRTIRVAANNPAALQSALNGAVGGDEIVLPNGSVYTGNFVLPKHSGSAAVTLRTQTVSVPPGQRVSPTTSSAFATITTPNSDAALRTTTAASNWNVIAIRFTLGSGAPLNYGMVRLGAGDETRMSEFPSNIVLDRVYMSAGTEGETRRCVGMNGAALAVVNSWLADCHSKGFDTQGIGGYTGSGPYLIENNWIEGSGQGVMFGGADPRIKELTPSDITIRRNYFFKPLSWGNGRWTVKAAFELKHARRVLFESNIIENHWIDAQTGFAILLQALSDNNSAAWTTIQDITIRNCVVRNSTGGIAILSRVAYGPNALMPSQPSRRILVQNVLFQSVGMDPFSAASGRLLQLLGDHEDVTIVQNTFTSPRGLPMHAVTFDGTPSRRLMLLNNVFPMTQYGVFGSGKGEGIATIDFFTVPGTSTVSGNILPGRNSAVYPRSNFFPRSAAAIRFVDATGDDYTLVDSPSNPAVFNNARVGVDGQKVRTATHALSRP